MWTVYWLIVGLLSIIIFALLPGAFKEAPGQDTPRQKALAACLTMLLALLFAGAIIYFDP